jgi:5'-nucleotidase
MNDSTLGGFARIAAVIAKEKNEDPETLVLDAGDFLMGSLFHALEPRFGFQLTLMCEMGYDAVALGNHEFDFGLGTLTKIIKSSSNGNKIPPVLLANIEFSKSSGLDDDLADLYSKSLIKDYLIIERKGLRIGIFGILGYDAASVAPYAAPVKFADPVKTAVRISKKLKEEEGVDIVICLSHCGVGKNKKGEWDGEDAEIARKAEDIDIIIGGHSHTRLEQPLMINGTSIVQAGANGFSAGRLVITFENGRVTANSYQMININDSIAGNELIHNKIEAHKKLIEREILNQFGLEYNRPLCDAVFDLNCDEQNKVEGSNLGPFLADALRFYVNSESGDSANITMVAAGTVRDNINAGKQSVSDIFRVVSLGSGGDSIPGFSVAKIFVTGRELKNIIEVLLAAYPSSHSYYCYYSGIRVSFNPEGRLLRKVKKIEMGDEGSGYRIIDPNKKNKDLYGIAASAYLLNFIGIIKTKSFGLVNVIPKDRYGMPVSDISKCLIDFNPAIQGIQEGKEWLGVCSFVKSLPDINSDGVPEIPEYYRNYPQRLVPTLIRE